MKYIVVLGDGMADYPVESLDGKTPLQVASKPHMDYMASRGITGTARMIPQGMPPGSDTANMAVLGYDPEKYYSGRSPFEAAGMKIPMEKNQVSFRCNLVTLSEEDNYEEKEMLDHSSDEISTEEAAPLIEEIKKEFTTAEMSFYCGMSYRHLLIWTDAPYKWKLTPPHDILEQKISSYLPAGEGSEIIFSIMKKSYDILKDHEINKKRVSQGLKPANSVWIWGEGKKPNLPLFSEKYGIQGSLISAVDLLKGMAFFTGMQFLEVPGATGNIHTNYEGKAEAAFNALKMGEDFVFIHVEAPDECGHQNDVVNKVKAIEYIDARVIKIITDKMQEEGLDYRMMVLPDHYTPLKLRTHTPDPVPFLIYESNRQRDNKVKNFDEENAGNSELFIPAGHELMNYFLQESL